MSATNTGGRSLKPNPFDFTRPVQDMRFFAGRERFIEEATYYLEMARLQVPNYHSIALMGERGIGKTSFLRKIQDISEKLGYLPVFLSLNERMLKSEAEFVKQLFDALMDAGVALGAFNGGVASVYKAYKQSTGMLRLDTETLGLPEVPFRFVSAFIGQSLHKVSMDISMPDLRHDLTVFFTNISNYGIPAIVLLFDECNLFTLNPSLFLTLRNVLLDPNLKGYVSVFAGTPKMYELTTETLSPVMRPFIKVYLPGFDIKETEECILARLSERERELFDFSCIEEIYRLTDGNPYELQLVCHLMYRRFERMHLPRLSLNQQVLDDVVTQLEGEKRSGERRIEQIKGLDKQDLSDLALFLPYEGWTINQITRLLVGKRILSESKRSVDPSQAIIAQETKLLKSLNSLAHKELVEIKAGNVVLLRGDRLERLYLKYYSETQKIKWDSPSPSYSMVAISAITKILAGTGLVRGLIERMSATERTLTLEEYFNSWNSQLAQGTLPLAEQDVQLFVIEERDFIRSVVYELRRPDLFANLLRLDSTKVTLLLVRYSMDKAGISDSYVEFLMPKNRRVKKEEALSRFMAVTRKRSDILEAFGIEVDEVYEVEVSFPTLGEIAERAAARDNKELVRDVQLAYVYEGREVFREDNVDKSIELFRTAVEMKVSNLDSLYLALAYNNLGFTLVAKGRYEEALREWRTALSLYPPTYGKFAMTYQDMSYVYSKLHQWEQALEACRQAIEVDQGRDTRVGWLWIRFCETNLRTPTNWKWELVASPRVITSSYCNMVAIFSAMNDFEAAQNALDHALQLSSHKSYVHRVKGWFELKQQKWSQAVQSFEVAKSKEPENAIIDEEIQIAANLVHSQL